jgi:hypothetical protein
VITMPTFIRPARVDITESGSGLGQLAALVAAAAAAVAVVLFVLAHLVLIATGLTFAAAVTVVAVRWLRRFMVLDWAPRPYRPTLRPAVTVRAISAPRREAIEAPRAAPAQTRVNLTADRRVR